MRLLGLDVGDRRIGVAVSDPLGKTAQPLEVLTRKNTRADMEALRRIVSEYRPVKVIIGLPLTMAGRSGKEAEKVRTFAETVGEELNVPFELHDERLTTVVAHKTLVEGGIRRKDRRHVADKLAAALILQAYIDSQSEK